MHPLAKILTAALVVLLVAGPVQAADIPVSDEARVLFRKGVGHLRDRGGPRYREAYQAFQEAYRISPSPKILGNLGLCAMKLERDSEAIDHYERYLNEAGAVSPKEHRQIIEDLVKLRGRGTQLRLAVSPPQVTVTDERLRDDGPPVVNDYQVLYGKLEIRVHVGQHRLTVRREGYEPVVWEFAARKRLVSKRTVELQAMVTEPEAEPVPPPAGDDASAPDTPEAPASGGVPLGVWVGAGTTGALAIATAVVGGLAMSNKATFDDELEAGNLDEARSLRDDGQTLNLVTDVLLGATVAAAATTVILFFVLDGDDDAEAAWTVGPSVGPGWAGLTLVAPF